MSNGAHQSYLEHKVLSATPAELVRIVYQTALEAIREAREALSQGDIRRRSAAISKALSAVSELVACLNHENGGSLSRNLAGLYGYMQQQLVRANIEQSDGPLAEVGRLLSALAEAWEGVCASASMGQVPRASAESTYYAGRPGGDPGYGSDGEYRQRNWSL